MAEMNGASGTALLQKGKRSKADDYVENKSGGQPDSGLGLTRSASAGTAKSQADLDRKGSRKS